MEEIGPRVTKGWKKGDRIAAFVHGGNDTHPDDGIQDQPSVRYDDS